MSHGTVVEHQETEKQNMGISVNDAIVLENMIAIPDLSCSVIGAAVVADLARDSENRSSDAGESCATGIENETTTSKVAENKGERKSWVAEVKCGDGDNEIICWICHLSSEQQWKIPFFAAKVKAKTDLIMLGCGCEGELSVAHSYCAEAWFKLKGNRICEICVEMEHNVRGVGNESFMGEWKESRVNTNASDSSDRGAEGCWQGQPLCNFLMACLVIAFVKEHELMEQKF